MVVKRRNNIVLVKRDTPKRVTLPNGRIFLAKYKGMNCHYLPSGTNIAQFKVLDLEIQDPDTGQNPRLQLELEGAGLLM